MAALRSPNRLKTEVVAGLVVALALIPEAISFSVIAGVDPRVELFASFTMAVTIAVSILYRFNQSPRPPRFLD
jgi:SulP family sulfate permease